MNESDSFPHLDYAVDAGVAVLTLNRPEVLNACNSDLHRSIQAAVACATADGAVKVIILKGAGRAFCSGSDLREVGQYRGDSARSYIRLDCETKHCVATCPKPVIGVLHGHVAGGGFELALACDIRVISQDTLFSLPEVRLGTLPGAGGLQRLPSIVGLGIAKEWAMSGRRIPAEEAYRTGLANHVFPLDELMPKAMVLAQEIARNNPIALTLIKRALDPEPPSSDGLIGMYHMLASQACHESREYQSNTTSYVAKT